jgi:UDP-N-acetylmuramoylalanine-D-glutamate ligase
MFAAHAMAQAGDSSTTAPGRASACASFDQFANFEERGIAFRRLVQALQGGPDSTADTDAGPLRRAQ